MLPNPSLESSQVYVPCFCGKSQVRWLQIHSITNTWFLYDRCERIHLESVQKDGLK